MKRFFLVIFVIVLFSHIFGLFLFFQNNSVFTAQAQINNQVITNKWTNSADDQVLCKQYEGKLIEKDGQWSCVLVPPAFKLQVPLLGTGVLEKGEGLAGYIRLVYTVAVSIVGILAVIKMMIGGIMWLTSGGNATMVSNAQGHIWGAIIGLVLVFVAYLLLNTINPSLVKLQDFNIEIIKPIAMPGFEAFWCQRPAPTGSENWYFNGIDDRQVGDASPELANFINCMYSLISELKINSISNDELCKNPYCDVSTWACGHAADSCHFGGVMCRGSSYAVDFATNVSCRDIEDAAHDCSSSAQLNWEGNHTHVSINGSACACNESPIGKPCP